MSEELLKNIRLVVKNGDAQLKEAKDLIARLKTAGEDTSTIERQYRITKARLDRYKKAFK